MEQFELFLQPPPPADATQARHLVLAGRIVEYHLRRDRRRLAMRIDERGLRVGAPRALPIAEIEQFIQSHADWVLDKLTAFADRTIRRHLSIHAGTRLPVLGQEITVHVTVGGNRGYWEADRLWLAARPQADLAQLARRALQRRALEYFRPRLTTVCADLGLPVPPLGLSSARTRWGSCSTQTGIRLNWRLIHLPPALIDYVIAHEAAHLVEMNHSARFWRVVASLYPEWETAREALKQQGASLPLI